MSICKSCGGIGYHKTWCPRPDVPRPPHTNRNTMSETETPAHFISHVHDKDAVYVKYECRAGRDAKCHQYPNCDCESGCDHPKVAQEECWSEAWMNESCAEECFSGPYGTPVHDGPVHISFNGDCVEWEYAEATK